MTAFSVCRTQEAVVTKTLLLAQDASELNAQQG